MRDHGPPPSGPRDANRPTAGRRLLVVCKGFGRSVPEGLRKVGHRGLEVREATGSPLMGMAGTIRKGMSEVASVRGPAPPTKRGMR
ncbi:hypothetical protein EV216_11559 [Rhodovulum steppense]|jgi:hypothetical protein|uniref:Uncharacterized protein n=1 Tax=Rhodovulum steppense TaxID=540251 RepID=A0A4R1YTA0_9RHOB|nr:hypothetical protein EV216_11559 [Rhodovulum steppense]